MIGTSIISMISWLTADSSADWNFATLMTINDYSGFEGFLYSTLLSLALALQEQDVESHPLRRLQ